MNIKTDNDNSAFTLVELAIVLIIIGLITGGVVGAQSLIKSAKRQQVITQYKFIQAAVKSFKLEYDELPGDFDEAEDYWGTAGDCYTSAAGTATCNGDGSGKLSYVWRNDEYSDVEYEPWHFWKHLSNAEILPGQYSGFSDNSTCGLSNMCMNPGVNTMKGPYNGSGWMVFSLATYRQTDYRLVGRAYDQDRNIISLSNPSNSSYSIYHNVWWGESISAKSAYEIDKKIDDGYPYKGIMVDMSGVRSDHSINCASANSDEFAMIPPGTTTINATYQFDRDNVGANQGCIPFFDLE